MPTSKLQRFKEIGEFENVLELTDFRDEGTDKPKGRWRTDIFGNSNPITLELACGKGEYTLALAGRYPGRNFIGIDIKGARIWKGAKIALQQELSNVRFLRIYIDHLDEYFAPSEVSEMWITFPDPYPRDSDSRKRLTSPKFLEIYQKVLEPGGAIHFKTDSEALYEFTKESLQQIGCQIHELAEEVHKEREGDPLLSIKTFYEKKHIKAQKSIKYVKFSLSDSPLGD